MQLSSIKSNAVVLSTEQQVILSAIVTAASNLLTNGQLRASPVPVRQVTPVTVFRNSAATTNAECLQPTAAVLWNVNASNINAAARYLKLYDKAVAPTVGTDVPVLTLAIGAGGSLAALNLGVNGLAFANGISFALTTGAADSDTGAVAAGEIKAVFSYNV